MEHGRGDRCRGATRSPASSKQRSRHSRRPFCLTHHGDDSANGKLGWHLADMLARSRGIPVTVLHLGRPEFVEGIETGPARRAEEAVSGVSETPQIGEPESREARALALVEIERDDAGTYCAPAPVSLARGKGLPAQIAKRSVHSAGLVSPAPDLVDMVTHTGGTPCDACRVAPVTKRSGKSKIENRSYETGRSRPPAQRRLSLGAPPCSMTRAARVKYAALRAQRSEDDPSNAWQES